jgi:hypothetical protein
MLYRTIRQTERDTKYRVVSPTGSGRGAPSSTGKACSSVKIGPLEALRAEGSHLQSNIARRRHAGGTLHMHMGMLGVPMINRRPVEPRAEIMLGLEHQLAREGMSAVAA